MRELEKVHVVAEAVKYVNNIKGLYTCPIRISE